jgi:hypothetical protein
MTRFPYHAIRDLVAEYHWALEFDREDAAKRDVSDAAFRIGLASPPQSWETLAPPRWARVLRRWEAKHLTSGASG